MNIRVFILIPLAIFALLASGCSDDRGDKSTSKSVDNYNDVASATAEQECLCYAESLGFSGVGECVEDRFSPEELSTCELEAVRCGPSSYRNALACRSAAMSAFQTCIEGCPQDPTDCRQQYEASLGTCNAQVSAELKAALNMCANGQTPSCGLIPTPDADPDVNSPSDTHDQSDIDEGSDTTESDTDEEATVCGDGRIGAGEACEGTDFGGKTCQTQGFGGGILTCYQRLPVGDFGL